MARISKDHHPAILRMVDVEGRKVADVAVEFGCTPANIYALLKKLRHGAVERQPEPTCSQPPLAFDQPPEVAAGHDVNVVAFGRPEAAAPTVAVAPAETRAAPQAAPEPARRGSEAVGARLAKPGFGLLMRTADGEEQVTPFRSLDDLLSAVKPILRASARSSEPVWFSLQPMDLTTIDFDAA
jgi:hypothetical protein